LPGIFNPDYLYVLGRDIVFERFFADIPIYSLKIMRQKPRTLWSSKTYSTGENERKYYIPLYLARTLIIFMNVG